MAATPSDTTSRPGLHVVHGALEPRLPGSSWGRGSGSGNASSGAIPVTLKKILPVAPSSSNLLLPSHQFKLLGNDDETKMGLGKNLMSWMGHHQTWLGFRLFES